MHRWELPVAGILAIALATAIMGCGGTDNGAFNDCGNGVLDAGEECDDGNLVDQDACLATCKFNVCGDTFLNVGVEQCDGSAFGDATCSTLGFAGGTLACTASCTFDTSGCTERTGEPTATATTTPSGSPGTPSPRDTSGLPNPTPSVTPGTGTVCKSGDQIVEMVSVDKPYGGLSLRLTYPAAANIPGSGTASSVKDRVVFAHTGGLAAVNDVDSNGDGTDDTLAVSSVDTAENPAGLYLTVTFDCLPGHTRPSAGDFTCVVQSASMPDGTEITDETCSVNVE